MLRPLRLKVLGLTVVFAAISHPLLAQKSNEDSGLQTDGQQETFPDYIRALRVVGPDDDKPIAPCRRALFSYADSARVIADGAIWSWGEGRPVAMAKCWKNRNGSQTCAFSLTSLEQVVITGPQAKVWIPMEIQVQPKELPGAPLPGEQAAGRLRQFKEQSRRFAAHEYWNPDNSRFELRLLVQPVHRYEDESRSILDGAVFLFASDNNPQILLLIEIVKAGQGKTQWQYLLARVSSAELHVVLDGKDIWQQDRTPGIVGKPTDFYWHMVTMPN